ncbi:MAG: exopolyphosphatase [Planctomycetaceae bacterium]|jgi:nanoRNase/pAp phosphatase (c-di-AMP/oligoRNAs hydrolase)|nr:exopolyphosphatase [Planctomycetaceae bacterium]
MRFVTRSDFDGLVCGMVLKEAGVIDSVQFVHPKDLQDGIFKADANDVLCNVPYVSGCGLWFDHHTSEADRVGWNPGVQGLSKKAPSCARIVYEYYGGDAKFPQFKDVIEAADKVDSGQLTPEDIRNPQGWVLVGFLADPRTGLGRFHDFRISNYNLMMDFIDHLRTKPLTEILEHPDVKERVDLYRKQTELFVEMVKQYTKIENNVIVTDLRGVTMIYTSNRFTVYSVFPEQNVSLWITDGKAKVNVMISCGYSVVNRTCTADIGALMLKHGGGGHKQVGTCQIAFDDADTVIADILKGLKE